MTENLIKTYHENKAEINNLNNALEKFREERRKEQRAIEDEIYEKIRVLEDRKYKKIRKIEGKIDREKKRVESIETELAKPIKQVEKILALIEVFKSGHDTNFEVYYYSDEDEEGNYISDKRKIVISPLEVLADDKYKKVAVYIVPNDKPKNKFTLIIRGKSIFAYYDIFQLRIHSYGWIGGIQDDRCNVEMNLKSLPTEKELSVWFGKNKQNFLKDFFTKHKQLESEYEKAIDLYKNSRAWRVFYWEGRKDYYENHYLHGTETEEYKEVLKELKKAKGG